MFIIFFWTMVVLFFISGTIVWIFSKLKSEKATKTMQKKEETEGRTGSFLERLRDWRNVIPAWIPPHAWQFFILLVIAYLVIWGLAPKTMGQWVSNARLFWFVSVGSVLLSIFFDFKKKRAIAALLFAVIFLNTLGMDRHSVEAFFEKKEKPLPPAREEIQYRLGQFSVIAPVDSWSEIVHIPRGARWEFDSRPFPIKIMRVNTGEVYRIEKDTDVRIPDPTYAVRFQSATHENVEVSMDIQHPR